MELTARWCAVYAYFRHHTLRERKRKSYLIVIIIMSLLPYWRAKAPSETIQLISPPLLAPTVSLYVIYVYFLITKRRLMLWVLRFCSLLNKTKAWNGCRRKFCHQKCGVIAFHAPLSKWGLPILTALVVRALAFTLLRVLSSAQCGYCTWNWEYLYSGAYRYGLYSVIRDHRHVI